MKSAKTWCSVFGCVGLFFHAVAAGSDEKPAAGSAEVAAYVGGEAISMQELDAKIMKTNMKLAQSIYDARRAVVDEIVMEKLLSAEAGTKGIPVADLVKQKIAERLQPVTDADVETFFNGNQNRMGGRPLEQVSGQIKTYLETQRETEAKTALLTELKSKSEVRIVLAVPRAEVEVAANDPSKGAADAKVTIVEFSEFQCPFCSRVGPTIKQIEEAYGDKVRIVFRDFTLPMHARAIPAAEAANCANEQGKFWEYHDKLFANQQALSDEDFKKHATELGLDVAAFEACYSSGKYREDVQKDAAEGAKLGVTGTPAFFINGRFLSGAQPFEAFKAIIDDEISRG